MDTTKKIIQTFTQYIQTRNESKEPSLIELGTLIDKILIHKLTNYLPTQNLEPIPEEDNEEDTQPRK
jgi:hypothetical protein